MILIQALNHMHAHTHTLAHDLSCTAQNNGRRGLHIYNAQQLFASDWSVCHV